MTAMVAALALLVPGPASAHEAGLDPTFGVNGHVFSEFGELAAGPGDVALAPDGSIVVIGSACTLPATRERQCELKIVRYAQDGRELQRTGAGFSPVPDLAPGALAVDPLGRIVVGGHRGINTDSEDWTPALIRYLPDGSIDETLSTADLPPQFTARAVNAVTIDPAGRILLAGPLHAEGGGPGLAVARLTAEGAADPSFGGGDGVSVLAIEETYVPDVVADMVLGADGTIYIGGIYAGPVVASPEVVALDAGGQPLPWFRPIHRFLDVNSFVTGIAVDSAGRLLVALSSGAKGEVFRLLPGGGLDRSFGTKGFAAPVRCQRCKKFGPIGVVVDRLDRPITASLDFQLSRYTASGRPDPTFAPRGSAATPFRGNYLASAREMVLDSSGRTIVVGARIEDTWRSDFLLARFGAPSCFNRTATIVGTPGDDHLAGTQGRDVVLAGGGDDRVLGGGGADLVCAGAGVDRVLGGSGSDRIFGQAGGDRIHGQRGNDFLHGGPGEDIFRDRAQGSRIFPGG